MQGSGSLEPTLKSDFAVCSEACLKRKDRIDGKTLYLFHSRDNQPCPAPTTIIVTELFTFIWSMDGPGRLECHYQFEM